MGNRTLPHISISRHQLLVRSGFFQAVLLLTLLVFFTARVQAQGGLFCNSSVEAALDVNCQATLDPDMVLEGEYPDYSIFTLAMDDFGSGNTVTITAPGTYSISVTDPTGNYCWSTIIAIDNFAPVLTCADVTLACTDDTSPVGGPAVPGMAAAYEPTVFEPCGPTTLSHSDQVIEGTCANPFRRQILRTWTAVNGSGLSSTCVQTITVLRATVADVTPPSNFDDFDQASFSCTDFPDNPNLLPDENGYLEVTRNCLATDFTLPLAIAANSSITVNFTTSDIPSIAEVSEVILNETNFGNLNFQLMSPAGSVRNSFQFADGFDGENPDGNWALTIINNHYTTQITELELLVKFQVLVAPGGSTCDNLNYGYNDTRIDICDGSYKILRNWQVVDWCVPGSATTFAQVLKVEDKKAPVFTCPSNLTIGTNFNDCESETILPTISLSDDCSADANLSYTVDLSSAAGSLVALPSGGYLVQGLPIGDHMVTYTAQDDCGNTSECELAINVQDLTIPAVVCESFHVVSLQNLQPGQVTHIFAQTFDDGTWDNCGPVTFDVRKIPGGFGPSVSFSCEDVGETVMVELRARDIYNNTNSCMVEVTVDDKVDPILTCPPNQNINCAGDVPPISNDISATPGNGMVEVFRVIQIVNGFATYTDDEVEFLGYYPLVENCGGAIYIRESGSLNNCGIGNLSRIWQAEDVSGNMSASCVQVISVSNNDPLTIVDTNPSCTPFTFGDHPQYPLGPHSQYDDVEWPCDITVSCTGPADGTNPSSAGEPIIFEDVCDLTAVTYEDLELPVTGSECRKILRKWIIVDWCQFNEVNGTPTAGYWTYTQQIKVNDTNDPVILDCADLPVVDADPNTCEGFVNLVATADDACTDSTLFNWSYVIDPNNDGQGATITGTTADASANFPIGNHKITWTVEDGCGNTATCTQLFYVADNAGPNIVALTSTSVTMVPQIGGGGNAELWATELDLSSFDNCNGPVTLSIQNPSLGLGQTSPPASISAGATFDCDDVPFVNIDLWAEDAAGNYSYVIVQVIVEDPGGIIGCGPPTVDIFGVIGTEENEPIDEVEVALQGTWLNGTATMLTDEGGNYDFQVAPGENYSITPEKDIDPLNGITTYDLILISKHILGIELLDSPYKMIAADINRSGAITAFDMVELRKLILVINENFVDNTSWRFVDAEYIFPDPTNPFMSTFPELVTFNNLVDNGLADFVGVKIGDVNNSAVTNLNSSDTRDRNGTLVFELEDKVLAAGSTQRIDFRAKDFQAIEGFQFALEFDPALVQFADFAKGALDISSDNFGFTLLEEGIITASWNGNIPADLTKEEVLFSFDFSIEKSTRWNKALTLSKQYLAAEAYNVQTELMDVALAFIAEDGTPVNTVFDLKQNQPNPFQSETTIRFDLPEASTATLRILDLNGRVLKVVEGNYEQGVNTIILQQNELNASGVLYYQLDTPTDSATKKMIILE